MASMHEKQKCRNKTPSKIHCSTKYSDVWPKSCLRSPWAYETQVIVWWVFITALTILNIKAFLVHVMLSDIKYCSLPLTIEAYMGLCGSICFIYNRIRLNWQKPSLQLLKMSDGANTLRPRQNDRHFPDGIFKCIFLNENIRLFEISLNNVA